MASHRSQNDVNESISGFAMSSTKSTSSFLLAAAVTVAAVAAAVYTQRRLQRRRDRNGGDDGKANTPNLKDGSQEALVNERFQACVKVMGPQLPRLPQKTQLEYYGLFKQGSLGDCIEYKPGPPPTYDLVATAKYQAWVRLAGMDRMTAMQTYIDKTIHFQFTKHLEDGGDVDYELEGDPAIDVIGLGDKPSTLAGEHDEDATALEDSKYPIHAASREGKIEELKKLIEESSTAKGDSSNTFPNTLDESGQTPLHLATDRGHLDCVKALILAGADINSVDNDGISILQTAVIGGDKACSELLLVLGANPDQADNDGDTPRGSAQDDNELKLLFQKLDAKMLTSEDILDPDFVQELEQRKIPIKFPKTTAELEKKSDVMNAKTEIKNSKTEIKNPKKEIKILDEPIDFELEDDGDMF